MATRLCPTGSYVLDAAGFVSVQAVRNAVAHPQCDGLSLYNGGTYGCTIEQVKIVVDAGKCVGPNWERRGNEAMFGAGAWAVDSARAGVEKWGIDPSSVPTILSGVDFSATPDVFGQLDYWHETACDRADATGTWIGYYGQTAYGNHLIQQPWWQRTGNRPTWTWGGSGMIPATNMKQHYGFPSGIDWSSVGVTVDESRVEAGLAMYAAEGDPEEAPVTAYIMALSDADARFEIDLNEKGRAQFATWLDTRLYPERVAAGYPVLQRTVADLWGITYVGSRLPQNDSKHAWTGAEFYDWVGRPGVKGDTGQQGPVGPSGPVGVLGPPGPSPKSATFTY